MIQRVSFERVLMVRRERALLQGVRLKASEGSRFLPTCKRFLSEVSSSSSVPLSMCMALGSRVVTSTKEQL
jgi:hypothetical protein